MSRLPWPSTYVGKFLTIAFVGVHIPLIGILGFVALSSGDWSTAVPVLVAGLCFTLIGTGATLALQWRLLAPVVLASTALRDYVEHRNRPDLPIRFSDDAGRLMANTQHSLTSLDELIQFKSDLLAMLSHDIRGFISSIQLANELDAESLEQGVLDTAELKESNEIVAESVKRLRKLISTILSMAKAENLSRSVGMSSVSAAALLDHVAGAIRVSARAKNIDVRVDVQLEDVVLDREKTEQALVNLATNAIKFTQDGGRIDLIADTTGHGSRFSVRDNGVGMSTATRENLFKPFSKSHRRGTNDEEGSGLGLWICSQLVQAQGGSIEVESTEDVGSCFAIVLPISCAQSAPAVASTAAGSRSAA